METQISLSPDLKAKIEREASAARGTSVSAFVRETLERATTRKREGDALFSDTAFGSRPASGAAKLRSSIVLWPDIPVRGEKSD